MATRRVLVLACCALSVPLTSGTAQTEPLNGVKLRAGQTVRVRLADGQRFEARLVSVDSSPLLLRFAEQPASVPISAIDSLWLRRRATGRGALIGGIVVGAGSFAFLTVVCRALSEGECNAWGAVIGLTLAGAGGGALLGAGIGSLLPRWQGLDPRRVTLSLGAGDRRVTAVARIRF